jgi:hypothetical protein
MMVSQQDSKLGYCGPDKQVLCLKNKKNLNEDLIAGLKARILWFRQAGAADCLEKRKIFMMVS